MKLFTLLILPGLFCAAASAQYPIAGENFSGQPPMMWSGSSAQPITENSASKNALVIEVANPEAVKSATTLNNNWENWPSQPSEMMSFIGESPALDVPRMIRRAVTITFGKFVQYKIHFHYMKMIKNAFTQENGGELTVNFVMTRNSELVEVVCSVDATRETIYLGKCKTSEDRDIEFAGPVGNYLYSPRTECGTHTKIAFSVQSLVELRHSIR